MIYSWYNFDLLFKSWSEDEEFVALQTDGRLQKFLKVSHLLDVGYLSTSKTADFGEFVACTRIPHDILHHIRETTLLFEPRRRALSEV